jgi:subtilase family serine protease
VLSTCFLLITAFAISDRTISVQQQDQEWYAEPMYIAQQIEPSAIYNGYTPTQIKTAYNLPLGGGNGTTIAIIDAYDAPTILADFTIFCNQFNLPTPTSSNFEIHKMADNIIPDSGWAREASLDVEWAHAIAPEAKILLVEAVSNNQDSLLDAIDYAKGRSDVVSISMSWGGDEPFNPAYLDSKLTSSYGAVFFASSGDNGSGICWPASSVNVVGVGGTTLNLNADGTVSETAWTGSGGGICTYEKIPTYQANYGITGSKRNVPDVSYNGNPSTGVPVYYNGNWYKVGGTSAGTPQWAAIQALSRSASNVNIYQKAKLDYGSYFRDITSGSNGDYNASSGYDCVTGLGSPLTFNFGVNVDVTPTSGTAGSALTLSGSGLSGGPVNVSYLNPISDSWVSVSNNTATASGSFSMSMGAPDLMQCNPSGDNPQSFDIIIFRVTDNSNSRSYNASTPYNQYRRGLTQVDNLTAQGLYGNNTNLATKIFVQDGDSLLVGGKWFSPGTATLLWDNTNLSTTTIDGAGQFNSSIIVPTAFVGQHKLTIQDSTTSLCVNISRYPSVATNNTDNWYTTDYTVNLEPNYTVNETFYRINGGPIQTLTANGQPLITTEAANNTVEYWTTWNPDGSALTETPHKIVSGIKLDKTAPYGSIMSNSFTQTAEITLYLDAIDDTSGVSEMHFSHQNGDWTNWEAYATTKALTLQGYDGAKTVFVQFRDNAGLVSTYTCVVTLQTPQASPTPLVTISPTSSPTAAPTLTKTAPSQTNAQTSPTPVAEFPVELAMLSIALASLMMVLVFKRRHK